MFQKIIIVGNLGQYPEMRYTPSGKAYARFSVAANRKWTDAEGQQREEVTWYRVTAWDKLAEVCNQYLSKGRRVLVESDRLHVQAYMNRDNQPAASIDLTAQTVRFLDKAPDAAAGGPGGQGQPAEEETEDIPF